MKHSALLGCLACLIALAGTLFGCAATPRAPSPQAADAATADRLKVALANDPRLIGRQVDVSVTNGVAQLSGWVESRHDLLFAQDDAEMVPGVLGVDEELVVIHGGGGPPR